MMHAGCYTRFLLIAFFGVQAEAQLISHLLAPLASYFSHLPRIEIPTPSTVGSETTVTESGIRNGQNNEIDEGAQQANTLPPFVIEDLSAQDQNFRNRLEKILSGDSIISSSAVVPTGRSIHIDQVSTSTLTSDPTSGPSLVSASADLNIVDPYRKYGPVSSFSVGSVPGRDYPVGRPNPPFIPRQVQPFPQQRAPFSSGPWNQQGPPQQQAMYRPHFGQPRTPDGVPLQQRQQVPFAPQFRGAPPNPSVTPQGQVPNSVQSRGPEGVNAPKEYSMDPTKVNNADVQPWAISQNGNTNKQPAVVDVSALAAANETQPAVTTPAVVSPAVSASTVPSPAGEQATANAIGKPAQSGRDFLKNARRLQFSGDNRLQQPNNQLLNPNVGQHPLQQPVQPPLQRSGISK